MHRNMLSNARLEEYTRVAYYYYKENNTQEQIAKRMKMSRQRVNRILSECLQLGIVQISINSSSDVMRLELETALKKKYGLQDARVVDNINPEDIFRDLGYAAGNYLQSILFKHCVVGASRGRTLAQVADLMPHRMTDDVTVVQLLGSRNQESPNTTMNEIILRLAGKLNAKPCFLFAPIVVGSAQLKQLLFEDPVFQNTYRTIQRCDISIVGIGNASRAKELYAEGGVVIEKQLRLGPEQIVAGEVASHIFDTEGRPVQDEMRDHVVAVELEDYMRIPIRIGVAGLPEKLTAIRGAMLGKYINVLVVDTATAKQLCEM